MCLRFVLLHIILNRVVSIIPSLHNNWAENAKSRADIHRSGLPCASPVKRAPVNFPKELLTSSNDAEGLEMHSGYINVTEEDYLFYWFVRAGPSAPANAPVLIWSNGGPGCSAMEGATTEIGPLVLFMAKTAGFDGFNAKFSKNPYAWNQKAHLLFVDQPRYVGYSCGTGAYTCSSQQAGLDMVTFLRGWRNVFPEIHEPEFILASESYGGHYVPAWAGAIMDYNEGASDPIRVVGLAIGNGKVNTTIQNSGAFIEWAKQEGLLSQSANPRDEDAARNQIQKALGYVPNYYDYRLEDLGNCCACYSYNYSTWSYWLLKDAVRKALNVCGHAGEEAFGGCAGGCIDYTKTPCGDFDRGDTFDYSGALSRALQKGIKVTLYYGKQDTACNYVGGYAMASDLQWSGARSWKEAELQELHIGGGLTGQIKSSGGLTWMQIDGAGHMTPINNPAAAFHALTTLLRPSDAVEVEALEVVAKKFRR